MTLAAAEGQPPPAGPATPALPALREELRLHPGPFLASGEPSHVLEDPVRNQFFRIDWISFEVLSRWSLGNPDDIALSINGATALELGPGDIADVVSFLRDNQLLRPDPLAAIKPMAARHKRACGTWTTQLLHHYLFFRIPLVKPDRWLNRIAPAFDWAFSATFARLTMLALVLGCVQIWRQWDQFHHTILDTFTPGGLTGYAIALLGVKCAHEMGHALAAKRHGCRVPAMGLAFLVLFPVPYTDTNDVWRLGKRRWRQQVAAAGVATELVIAAWSTLAWALLPDGLLRSVAFALAGTTWIATLLVNASPFMRFDGYFVLSDWLDMPNLHARAFALARWDLRERLFGIGAPPPEHFGAWRRRGLILFAWSVWIYRLLLFFGVALLVYHFFIKMLGIMLFAIEIVWFILRPIGAELRAWQRLMPALRRSRRARVTAMLAGAALILFAVPWPARLHSSAMLRPTDVLTLYAPAHARLAALPSGEGARVKAGDVMMEFSGLENASRVASLEAQVEQLKWQSGAAAFDSEQRARSTVLAEQLVSAQAQLELLRVEAARMRPVAPFDGRLTDVDPELAPGVWVAKNEKLAVLVGGRAHEASAYLDEEEVRRIARGDAARFYPDGLEGPYLRLRVTAIDQDATRTLPSALWAAQYGGSVPAREKGGQWYPERAVYRVTLAPIEAPAALAGKVWRGTVVIAGAPEAPGMRFLRSAATLLRREAGF
jgi:putative peptide zinc metalloprotease protein